MGNPREIRKTGGLWEIRGKSAKIFDFEHLVLHFQTGPEVVGSNARTFICLFLQSYEFEFMSINNLFKQLQVQGLHYSDQNEDEC